MDHLPLMAYKSKESSPWAERIRPTRWEDFLGQDAAKKLVCELAASGNIPHLLLYGPPGTGKTTLSRLLRSMVPGLWFEAHGADFSAAQMRDIVKEANTHRAITQEKCFLVIDEIHRLSRAQQDHLLDPLETGTVILIGTTTENPYVAMNKAVLSRVRVLQLHPHTPETLKQLLHRSVEAMMNGQSIDEVMTAELQEELLRSCEGDARRLIANLQDLSSIRQMRGGVLELKDFVELRGESASRALSEDQHYDILSAFIKSIRGSDPDAALLWMAHLIRGGMDPRMIARRMVISAAEDIGNADPRALGVAIDAAHAVDLVGLPEVGIVLSQVVIYLCCSPKSNSAYSAYQRALAIVDRQGLSAVPHHLTAKGRKDYQSPHLSRTGFLEQIYRPSGEPIYVPTQRGFETKLVEYLEWMKGQNRK
ncbi:MAG: AAA family ATPase [Bdellovibrio sp.]|nr:MAG: AAA family ATPase [Bdellovibrio sp.]